MNGGELAERDLLAARSGDENLPDLFRGLPELGLEPNQEVERLLALHHRGGGDTADRRLDQSVHVGDVDAVARDPVAIDREREAGLAQLLHHRDPAHASYAVQHPLDRPALRLQHLEVG